MREPFTVNMVPFEHKGFMAGAYTVSGELLGKTVVFSPTTDHLAADVHCREVNEVVAMLRAAYGVDPNSPSNDDLVAALDESARYLDGFKEILSRDLYRGEKPSGYSQIARAAENQRLAAGKLRRVLDALGK